MIQHPVFAKVIREGLAERWHLSRDLKVKFECTPEYVREECFWAEGVASAKVL